MNRKVAKQDLLEALNQLNEEELARTPEIEYPLELQERMEKVYREAYAKKRESHWRPIAAAAAILFTLFFTNTETVAKFMEQFSVTQVGEDLVIERMTPLPKEKFDFSNVTYEVPEGYILKFEYTDLSYQAEWNSPDGGRISVGVSNSGTTNFDNEYAEQMHTDEINGIEVTIYKKFETWVAFGQDEQFLYDVIGDTDLGTVKKVFASIVVEGE